MMRTLITLISGALVGGMLGFAFRELIAAALRMTEDPRTPAPGLAPTDDAAHHLAIAVLLFHAGGPWDDQRAERWKTLTGAREATTVELCNLARRTLAGRPLPTTA